MPRSHVPHACGDFQPTQERSRSTNPQSVTHSCLLTCNMPAGTQEPNLSYEASSWHNRRCDMFIANVSPPSCRNTEPGSPFTIPVRTSLRAPVMWDAGDDVLGCQIRFTPYITPGRKHAPGFRPVASIHWNYGQTSAPGASSESHPRRKPNLTRRNQCGTSHL